MTNDHTSRVFLNHAFILSGELIATSVSAASKQEIMT